MTSNCIAIDLKQPINDVCRKAFGHWKTVVFSVVMLLVSTTQLSAQEESLANRYFDQGEYEKALSIYLDLYKSNNSPFYYQRITKSYIALDDLDEAISFIKRSRKKSRGLTLQQDVDLVFIYRKMEDDKSAEKETESLINYIAKNPTRAQSVTRLLSEKGLYDISLRAYEAAEKANPNLRLTYQKSMVYAELGQLKDMYNSYVAMVEESPGYLTTVKSLMSRSLSTDPDDEYNEHVKATLLKRIQKTDNDELVDLLIHVFMHENNYPGALRQAIARDKRTGGNQNQVFSLGRLSAEQGNFKSAFEAFDYIIERKPPSDYVDVATVERLKTRKLELDQTPKQVDYEQLAKDIRRVLNMNDWRWPFSPLALTLAEIDAYVLDNVGDAIKHLKKIQDIPRIPDKLQIESRLLLGDIYLFHGKYTNALLAYTQAEKLAGDQPLGDEAKFRSGRVSYFQADFDYALSTFDVLKSSTSKHTANNAMKLSLLIRENTMLDTSYEAMTRFAQADLKYHRKLYEESLRELRLLSDDFPNHSLQDEILFLKAKIQRDKMQFEEAVVTLENMLERFPDGILADEALLMLGVIYSEELGQLDKAQNAFEILITDFPNSYYVSEARRRYRELRGDINF